VPTVEIGWILAAGNNDPADLLVTFGPTLAVTIQLPAGNVSNVMPALVDTGASESSIDDALAQQLGLPVIDQALISGVGGQHTVNVYLARVFVPPLNVTQYGRFAGVHLQSGGQSHRAILGRTLLKECTLIYDGPAGSVKISHNP
jgi:predicted aspartyl protease